MPFRDKNIIDILCWIETEHSFPPLRIKLGFNKHFSKIMDKGGGSFIYLCQTFPGLAIEKLKYCIFDRPQICQYITEPEFLNSMNEVELDVWKAFVLVLKNFLTTRNYAERITNMLGCFKKSRMQYDH